MTIVCQRVGETASVHVVTLLWNNAPFAEAWFTSLLREVARSPVAVHVLLVVNGPEGRAAHQAVTDLHETAVTAGTVPENLAIDWLQFEENRGFTGGMNSFRHRAGTALYVFVNFDLTFEDGFFAALTPWMAEADRAFLLGPAVTGWPGGSDATTQPPLRLSRTVRHAPLWSHIDRRPLRTDAISGACIIASRGLVDRRLGERGWMFRPDLFAYAEDLDLLLWCRDHDIPVYWDPRPSVSHFHAGSFGGRYRLIDRDAEWIARAIGNRRAVLAEHRLTPGERAADLASEALLSMWLAARRGPSGLRGYARSFKVSRALRRAVHR